jgi:hypothetical protein
MQKHLSRAFALVVICGFASLATPAAAGRAVLVDVGDNYEFNGQRWSANPPGEPNYAPGANTGTIPFALNFGDGLGATHSFAFRPEGKLDISDGAGSFASGYFIAPLLASSPYQLADPTNTFGSFMRWGAGKVDPALLDDLPNPATFDIANALDAFRFTWFGVCQTCTGADEVSFQVLLIDRKNGDFDLDFNYAGPATGQFGFKLGNNEVPLAVRTFDRVGPDYCFRGGVGSLCGSVTAVPEPETWALMMGGLGLLGAAARRRAAARKPLP